MYRSDLHQILFCALKKASWTRSTKDEDNFRQVVCAHLYEYLSPNNTEIPSTRSGAGDIRIFGRKIEIKYSSYEKRDKLDLLLDDFDLLLSGRVDFCIISLRFDRDHDDLHLSKAVDLPLLKCKVALSPISIRNTSVPYYGPGIFLPVCYPGDIKRISITTAGTSKKTNSYIRLNRAANIDRSTFVKVGDIVVHVDAIGSCEDGLLTLLYKRAEEIGINIKSKDDVLVPYSPASIKIAEHLVCDISTLPKIKGKNPLLLEESVSVYQIKH